MKKVKYIKLLSIESSSVHTRLRTMISEPACTARCKGVSLEASWTLEFTLAWTLIRKSTLSISEFWTATWRKFRPLLSTWGSERKHTMKPYTKPFLKSRTDQVYFWIIVGALFLTRHMFQGTTYQLDSSFSLALRNCNLAPLTSFQNAIAKIFPPCHFNHITFLYASLYWFVLLSYQT